MTSATNDGAKTVKTFFQKLTDKVTDAIGDFLAKREEAAAKKRQAKDEKKAAAAAAASGIPVFEDVTRRKTEFKIAPAKKVHHSVLPGGLTIAGTEDGAKNNQVALPSHKAGANLVENEPVYHYKKDAPLTKNVKKVLTAESDKETVRTVLITFGEQKLSLPPSQIKAFIETAQSLSHALVEIPMTQALDENKDETTAKANVKTFDAPSDQQQYTATA